VAAFSQPDVAVQLRAIGVLRKSHQPRVLSGALRSTQVAETQLLPILRKQVTQQVLKVRDDQEAGGGSRRGSPGAGLCAQLIKWFERALTEKPNQITIRFPPAGLAHAVLESHLVYLFGGGDVYQPGEHAREVFARRCQQPIQPILVGVELHTGQFGNGVR